MGVEEEEGAAGVTRSHPVKEVEEAVVGVTRSPLVKEVEEEEKKKSLSPVQGWRSAVGRAVPGRTPSP